jgi:hypothetical protein
MVELQRIVYDGRLAAIVLGEQAIIDDTLAAGEHRFVQAMCLYALEVKTRERPGPYSDQAAESYAQVALARAG